MHRHDGLECSFIKLIMLAALGIMCHEKHLDDTDDGEVNEGTEGRVRKYVECEDRRTFTMTSWREEEVPCHDANAIGYVEGAVLQAVLHA